MTILDKIIATVTPLESDEERQTARAGARKAAVNSPWLVRVLEHHQQIEMAFVAVKHAGDGVSRR